MSPVIPPFSSLPTSNLLAGLTPPLKHGPCLPCLLLCFLLTCCHLSDIVPSLVLCSPAVCNLLSSYCAWSTCQTPSQGCSILPNLAPAFFSAVNWIHPPFPFPIRYGPATCLLSGPQAHPTLSHTRPIMFASCSPWDTLPWASALSSNVQVLRPSSPNASSLSPCLSHCPAYLLPCTYHGQKLSCILVYRREWGLAVFLSRVCRTWQSAWPVGTGGTSAPEMGMQEERLAYKRGRSSFWDQCAWLARGKVYALFRHLDSHTFSRSAAPTVVLGPAASVMAAPGSFYNSHSQALPHTSRISISGDGALQSVS